MWKRWSGGLKQGGRNKEYVSKSIGNVGERHTCREREREIKRDRERERERVRERERE